jgi:UDP-N-acetyl-D-mannosaminuronic acid dehydrogenase
MPDPSGPSPTSSTPRTRQRINVIGGCGHVGLPLALALADIGHDICIHDIDEEAIASIAAGKMPFKEAGAEPLLQRLVAEHRLAFSTRPESISECEIAILIIGTPVDGHLNPKFRVIKETLDALYPHFRDGQLLILRSTVFPGISEKVQSYFHDRGKRVSVSFCPERIAEGAALQEFATLPQIVSGFSPEAVERARSLFAGLSAEIIVLEPLEAELTKLFTNAYRYIKFSIANQFYEIANDYGIDFYKIHHAMTYHYPRAQDFPGAGFAAGPCLFKDTMQLAAFNNNNFFLGHAAMLINEGLPTYIVGKLKQLFPLHHRRVGILGMAFKANSDDKRESLSYKLKKILEIEAERVLCSDVYLHDEGFVSAEQLIDESDIIVLGAPHREYRHLDLRGKRVVDVWNFYQRGGLIQ